MASTTPAGAEGAPAIMNLPKLRNPHFVGRDAILQAIERGLSSSNPRGRVQALTGNVGMGKTEIALEYAYSRHNQYDIIWWVHAQSPSSIANDLAALAARLDPEAAQQDPLEACATLRKALQHRNRWLIIFDDAQNPNDLTQHLVWGSWGNVLITSRSPQWAPMTQAIIVKQWPRKEAMEFLRNRLPGPADDATINKLALTLGDHPLALEQASACIEQTQITADQYLQEYEVYWGELLLRGVSITEHPTPEAMAWELSLRQVEKIDPIAVELLNLCAFLGEDVPWLLIRQGPDALPERLKEAALNLEVLMQAGAVLNQFSVAQASEKSITISRVVATLARNRLPAEQQTIWATAAMALASQAFPFDSKNSASWPQCAESLPHVIAAAGLGQTLASPAIAADLLDRAGRFLLRRAQFAEAQQLLEQAMKLVKAVHGPQSPKAADIANNLGRARQRMGNFDGAMELFESALQIDGPLYGPGDPHMATVANNLGITLASKGNLQRARDQFQWTLEVYQKHYGQDHPRVASVRNNLGYVLCRLNQPQPAREHLSQALTVAEAHFGMHHPSVACIATNFADLCAMEGNIQEARSLLERALTINTDAYGHAHPAVAVSLARLGELMRTTGDLPGAIDNLQQAVQIMEAVSGPPQPELPSLLKALGRAYRAAGNGDRADEYAKRAAGLSAQFRPSVVAAGNPTDQIAPAARD